MPNYDQRSHAPPAPVALVVLRSDATGLSVSGVPMLLDSGSDVTLVPSWAVEQLAVSLESQEQCELEGFNGVRSRAPIVRLELIFEGHAFRGQFVAIPETRGILGRNTLNRLKLILDGPNLTWDVSAR